MWPLYNSWGGYRIVQAIVVNVPVRGIVDAPSEPGIGGGLI